ncbi:hypothetical protein M5689_012720 [Euphorbia peplus]|nr:hypothetical protein M5689_012720 [Euphorbia peplus]
MASFHQRSILEVQHNRSYEQFIKKLDIQYNLANKKVHGLIIILLPSFQDWRGEPGQCSSATQRRLSKAPMASHCDGRPPLKNKINIVWTNGPHIRY